MSERLQALLQGSIKARGGILDDAAGGARPTPTSYAALWPASFFGLDRVSAYRRATEEQRERILNLCARDVLEEAYLIEKCGMLFTARMSLLSETTEERMLYSLFSSDEAIHFHWISGQLAPEDVRAFGDRPFIRLLNQIVEEEDKPTLTYIIQVVLEGWGIHHYHRMAAGSRDAGLRRALELILRDEARHHGSGLVLFNAREADDRLLGRLVEILVPFFRMVQAGPQSVVGRIEETLGHLSREQRARAFRELSAREESQKRLDALQGLMRSARHSETVLDRIASHGVLVALSPEACALEAESRPAEARPSAGELADAGAGQGHGHGHGQDEAWSELRASAAAALSAEASGESAGWDNAAADAHESVAPGIEDLPPEPGLPN